MLLGRFSLHFLPCAGGDAVGVALLGSDAARRELAAQRAALRLLSALLSVGAALLTPEQRLASDGAVLHIAMAAAAAACKLARDADGSAADLDPLQVSICPPLVTWVL